MPMFGTFRVLEGHIGQDGTFELTGSMQGERHLMIIGKDKQPVKVVGIDVTVGTHNEQGTIDLTGSCPK